LWVDPQASAYFITINCQKRATNQLALAEIAKPLLDSVRFRNERFVWFAHIFLIMPDHVHALLSFPSCGPLSPGRDGRLGEASPPHTIQQTISLWKRWTALQLKVQWQRDFFEHRLRSEENWRQKADYIWDNPVRKGLVKNAQDWPYVFFPLR
jgi:REP element-mobilizing transposase RayT